MPYRSLFAVAEGDCSHVAALLSSCGADALVSQVTLVRDGKATPACRVDGRVGLQDDKVLRLLLEEQLPRSLFVHFSPPFKENQLKKK